jgi:predicted outer membrane repeat protein
LRVGNALTMSLSHVSHNSGGFGGGVYCEGTCTITQSSIQNNEASRGGGGLYFNHSSSQVINHTTVANNTSMNSGGGIFVNRGPVTISNVTLSGNDAGYHGGGIASSATTTLNHVTVVNNRADANNSGGGDGGGIYRNGGTLNLRNSVVAGNSYLSGSAPDCGGTITSQFYNHIGNITGCTFTPGTGDVTGSDPDLGPLADNGGIGQTHRPNVGSPLLTPLHRIPNGVNDCGDVITVDQRGAARPFGGSCAKGAVEVRETIPSSSCGGADLSGTQEFDFTSGNTVTVTITTANELNCITVEEMGSDHPAATGTMGDSGIYTGNWWHISGNIDSGFEVTVTLPHSGLGNPQVCKYPGTEGGYGWDCDRTHYDASTVWLNEVGSFSDWAVGDNVGPTAVSTLHTQISTPNQTTLVITTILATLLALFSGAALWLRRTV